MGAQTPISKASSTFPHGFFGFLSAHLHFPQYSQNHHPLLSHLKSPAMSEITPVTEWPDYSVDPQGGNPITQDLNAPYDKGDLYWVLVCTILCWQITPAIGYLYAGMHRRKAALTMIFQSLFCACACGIQFWIYGYSLYQSRATNPMLGNLSLAGLHNVLAAPSLANSDIPDILYAAYGFTFVTATAMILAGAMLERGRLWPSMLFLLCFWFGALQRAFYRASNTHLGILCGLASFPMCMGTAECTFSGCRGNDIYWFLERRIHTVAVSRDT